MHALPGSRLAGTCGAEFLISADQQTRFPSVSLLLLGCGYLHAEDFT